MIVLAGANSVLGNYLLPLLRNKFQVCAFDQERGDILDKVFLNTLMDEVQPQIFINCAQYGNIEEAEYKREDAYKINSFAPESIASICKEKNIKLIQLSTSYVFDGESNKPYKEEDKPHPLSVYGDSKLLGEQKILESGCRHLIVRVPDIIGRHAPYIVNIINILRNQHIINVIEGQKVCPTYAGDIADGIMKLIDLDIDGIINFSNDGSVNTADFIYELTKQYIKLGGSNFDYNVNEQPKDECLSPVDWPLSNLLDNSKFKELTKMDVRSWKDALTDCLKNLLSNY